jgi:hypothetical protein
MRVWRQNFYSIDWVTVAKADLGCDTFTTVGTDLAMIADMVTRYQGKDCTKVHEALEPTIALGINSCTEPDDTLDITPFIACTTNFTVRDDIVYGKVVSKRHDYIMGEATLRTPLAHLVMKTYRVFSPPEGINTELSTLPSLERTQRSRISLTETKRVLETYFTNLHGDDDAICTAKYE